MRIGKFLYKYRSLTPVAFTIVLLIFSKPSILTIITGIVFSLFGELIRSVSVAYTGLTTRSKNVQTDILVTNGPYGYVRNPIYLGNFFLSLGVVIAANTFFPWFIVVYILLFAVQYYFIIRFEEEFLKERFGEEHERYVYNVPSFFPKLKPYRSKSSIVPNLRMTLRSEKTTLILLILLYAVILFIYVWQRKL